jgi:UDP-glucose 4-epimerase
MDIVYHLAAQASVARSVAAPLETLRTNTTGTAVLAEASRNAGIRRFVMASTCAVYPGSTKPIAEHHPLRPTSPYAASKLAAESWLMAARESLGLSPVILRLFNVIGSGQRADSLYGAVVPRFVAAMKHGKSATILGDGRQTRDFVHVDDAVAAMLAAGASGPLPEGPVNVGSGNAVSVIGLHEAIAKIAEDSGEKVLSPVFGVGRLGEVRDSVADIRFAGESLGWRPMVSLEAGLRRIWDEWES